MRHIPKRDFSARSIEALKIRVWALPFLDRMTILIASVLEHERDAAVIGLIRLVTRMAAQYSNEARMEFGERLRDAADQLDRDNIDDDELRWMTTTAGECK